MKQHLPALLAGLSLLLCACHESGGGPGAAPVGTFSLEVTDAPFAHDVVSAAIVRIDSISISEQPGPGAKPLRIYDGPWLEVDLAQLRDGATRLLLERGMRPGTWRELRVHVVGARLVLTNGNVFDSGLGNLSIAPQDPEGFPVPIDPSFTTGPGSQASHVLDIDLARSFIPDLPADPLAATSFELAPVMRLADMHASGSIEGLVEVPDGGGGSLPQGDATVYVVPPGETDVAQALASSASVGAGTYMVLGIPAGTWDVIVVHGDLQGAAVGQVVVAGQATLVDVTLQ